MSEDDITRLPVKFKKPPANDKMLLHPQEAGKKYCRHKQLIIDEKADAVECAACGERLNPMWALSRLATEETQWTETRKAYQEEMDRLNQRVRTKCQHCGRITNISRK